MEHYLKCGYKPGLFPSEYVINFRVSNPDAEESLFVNKADVKPINQEKGLVKLRGCSEPEDGKVLVEINDVGDCRLSSYAVYLDDIVSK